MRRIFVCCYRQSFLAALVALVSVENCMARARAGSASAPPKANSSQSAVNAPASAQAVVMAGSPSFLRVANTWPWEKHEEPCATFRVEADASITSLDLYTTGLGRTLLVAATNDPGVKCPPGGSLRLSLKKGTDANIATFIAIKVDTQSLSSPGASMQGTVVALAGTKKVADFALKVERSPREEIFAAGLWTLGVIIPAAVTLFFGQIVVWLTALQKAKNDFADYRLKNIGVIHDFLARVDTIIRTRDVKHPGTEVYQLILAMGVFSQMTRRGIRSLSRACATDDLRDVVRALKELFPEHDKPVADLEKSLGRTE